MIGAVILTIAVAAIAWSAWAEAQVGREARRDRDFARRHQVRINQIRRDPSPTPRTKAS